jgi:hypothetical protein
MRHVGTALEIGFVLFIIGLALAALSFAVYCLVVEVTDARVEVDAVVVHAEDGRKFRYVKTTDPWFGIITDTKPEIVPLED